MTHSDLGLHHLPRIGCQNILGNYGENYKLRSDLTLALTVIGLNQIHEVISGRPDCTDVR